MQALRGSGEDFGLYLCEMGAGERRDLTGFDRIPLAAVEDSP